MSPLQEGGLKHSNSGWVTSPRFRRLWLPERGGFAPPPPSPRILVNKNGRALVGMMEGPLFIAGILSQTKVPSRRVMKTSSCCASALTWRERYRLPSIHTAHTVSSGKYGARGITFAALRKLCSYVLRSGVFFAGGRL